MSADTLKQVLPYVLAILTAVGGFTGGVTSEVSGARAWKEANLEELTRVRDLERDLAALKAQNRTLLELLDGATIRTGED